MNPVSSTLYVIIPVLNGWRKTRECLCALFESDYKNFLVIVVDHGSTDDTKQLLPSEFPDVIRLSGDESMWWAGATNVGIRYALEQEAGFVMLLNNDCYIAPDAMGLLMREAESTRDTVIAPVQRSSVTSEIVSLAPYTILWLGFAGCRGPVKLEGAAREKRLIDVRMIGGGRGVVIPASVLETVGILDEESLPHYYADHDFYLRCRAAGVSLKTLVPANVYVDDDHTSMANEPEKLTFRQFFRSLSDRRSHRNLQNLAAFFRKHYPVKRLYFIGVVLTALRYSVMYLVARVRNILFRG